MIRESTPPLNYSKRKGIVFDEKVYVGKRGKEISIITNKERKATFEWFKKSPDLDLYREEFLLKLFLLKIQQNNKSINIAM